MRDFETGIVYVNAGTTGAEVHLPFGGWKETGNGHREAGHVALDTYTEWKSIYVDFCGPAPARPDRQPAGLTSAEGGHRRPSSARGDDRRASGSCRSRPRSSGAEAEEVLSLGAPARCRAVEALPHRRRNGAIGARTAAPVVCRPGTRHAVVGLRRRERWSRASAVAIAAVLVAARRVARCPGPKLGPAAVRTRWARWRPRRLRRLCGPPDPARDGDYSPGPVSLFAASEARPDVKTPIGSSARGARANGVVDCLVVGGQRGVAQRLDHLRAKRRFRPRGSAVHDASPGQRQVRRGPAGPDQHVERG